MSGAGNNVIKTTNGGTTWANATGNLSAVDAYCIHALDENFCWIGAGDGTIYRTTNGGVNWSFAVPSPTTPFVDGIYFYNQSIGFAFGDCVSSQWRYWYSTNGGATWTAGNAPNAGTSTEAGWNNGFATTDSSHIWWTSNNSRIYYGSLRGTFQFGTTSAVNQFGMFMQDNNTGVAICNNGSASLPNARTTNGGVAWANTSFTPTGIAYGIKGAPTVGSWMYWISGTSNIYRSTDNGVTFSSQFTLSNAGYCITMYSVQLGWVGTAAGHIYKYTSSDPVGIQNTNNQVPNNYSLSQNYPNPFNPTTTINFSIPNSSNVSLKIYDILGNEVMTVVNEFKHAGNYSVNFDASRLSSGVYFYTITAGNFKDTKKMMLTK
jgi:photosystem II stability/assembly factor-like uncharacterized protein